MDEDVLNNEQAQPTFGKCLLIQNSQLQLDSIPLSLKKLGYGVYPNDPSYNDLRFDYNKLFNYFPKAIFYPRNKTEIVYLINKLVTNKLVFVIRGGGRGFSPVSISDDYVVDLSHLISKFDISTDRKTVTVDAGFKIGEIIEALGKHSLLTNTVPDGCIGIIGSSLASGFTVLKRMYGLASDSIVSAKMINYKGELLYLDKDNYSDLFWAIKGAGNGNFGIITEITLNTYEDIWLKSETLTWKWNKTTAIQIFKLYQKQIATYPKNVSGEFFMEYNNSLASFTITIYVFGKSTPIADYTNIFKHIGEPIIIGYSGYYSKTFDKWGIHVGVTGLAGVFSKAKSSIILKPISDSGIISLVNSIELFLQLKLDCKYVIDLQQFGGEIRNGSGSFAFKEAIGLVFYLIRWSQTSISGKINKLLKEIYTNNVKYISQYCIFSFIDYDLSQSEYMNAYFGNNTNRLIEIKKKYDPHNLFKYKQSIPIKH